MTDLVSYAVADGVAHIELNRPEVSNAVDLPTAHALDGAIAKAGADDSVRAVLLTGAGKRFCAGGDVASMVASTVTRPVISRSWPGHSTGRCSGWPRSRSRWSAPYRVRWPGQGSA